jgi:CheY-like chemotaxis protein
MGASPMKKKEFGGVKVMLAMENPIIRQGLQNAMQNFGFGRAIEVTALDRMISTLIEGEFDVILASSELGNEVMAPFLAQLRQGGLVHHPIPVIITFLASAETEYVRKAIDCGPDDLLQMPIIPGQLLSRLELLAKSRKTFVVTSDYVGPDRRNGARAGAMVVPTLDVPNPFAMRVAQRSEEEIDEAVGQAAGRLRHMRLARYAFELQWLFLAIRTLFDQKSSDKAKLISFCERIKTLLLGLPRLLPDGVPKDIEPLVERLDMGSNILIKNGLSADATIVQGVGKLVMTLAGGLRKLLPPDLAETTLPARAAS